MKRIIKNKAYMILKEFVMIIKQYHYI